MFVDLGCQVFVSLEPGSSHAYPHAPTWYTPCILLALHDMGLSNINKLAPRVYQARMVTKKYAGTQWFSRADLEYGLQWVDAVATVWEVGFPRALLALHYIGLTFRRDQSPTHT